MVAIQLLYGSIHDYPNNELCISVRQDNDQVLNGGSTTADRRISFVTALPPVTRSTALASPYKLVVVAGSWTRANADGSSASDILRLYVCRFADSETE